MNEIDFKSLNFTLLGKDSSIEGDFTFSGDTLINGSLKGSLTIINDGQLVLERNSIVEGQIFCNDIEIFGEFKGKISSNGLLTVRSSGSISGTIEAKKMNLYPGATVNMEANVDY